MLKVVDYETIRSLHSKGWPIKRISRELGYSRKAVRKALREWNGQAPRYVLTRPRPRPVVTEDVRSFVRDVLTSDKGMPRKQRHSADKIHKRLIFEKQAKIGRSTTRAVVREIRQELRDHPPATTPLYFAPGEEAQFDWGEVYLSIAGVEVKANLFVAVLCHSRRTFLQVFPHQNQEAFLEAHLLAFEDWGGSPARWAYDNLKAAVKKVLIGGEREESDLFKRFRSYHGADARFCTPGIEGAHEKGRVEKKVETGRSSAFVPMPAFTTWAEANAFLLEHANVLAAGPHPDSPDRTIAAVFSDERKELRRLPRYRFAACKVDSYVVDGQARVRYDRSYYSLPCEYGRQRVEVRAYHDRVEFYRDGKLIRNCPRNYRPGSENFDYQHYIKLLRRAPGACLNGKPYLEMPRVLLKYRSQLLEHFARREAGRHLAKILQLVPDAGEGRVCEAVELAMLSGTLDADAVVTLLEQLRQALVPRCKPMDLADRPELKRYRVTPPNPEKYDELQEVHA